MSASQENSPKVPQSTNSPSKPRRNNDNNKNAFKSKEEEQNWHKKRVLMLEDILIDLCCAKALPNIARDLDRRVQSLNNLIAQFSLAAMHFCEWKKINMRVDFTEKVAERYMLLSGEYCTMEHAREQVTRVENDMKSLVQGFGIRKIVGHGSAAYLNIRIAVLGTQALSTLKDAGVEKDIVLEAIAKMLAGTDADRACEEAVAESDGKLKVK